MLRLAILAIFTFSLLGGAVGIACGQPLSQRIQAIRDQKARQAIIEREMERNNRVQRGLQTSIRDVSLEQIPARDALQWISHATGVPMVVNWTRLAEHGIDPQQPVSIIGADLSTLKALQLLAEQLTVAEPLMWNVTPWYVELLTKDQANHRTIVMTYPIGDLIMPVPDFDNAPSFDLVQITQGRQGGRQSTESLFQEARDADREGLTRAQRAGQLADLIRHTIEPDLWRANGGLHGTITVYRDSLIIRAPAYVHHQIGGGVPAPGRRSQVEPAVRTHAAPVPGVGAVLHDPQGSVAQQGRLLDVQGAVSHDRRYVTLTSGFTAASVRRVRSVPVPSPRIHVPRRGQIYRYGHEDAAIARPIIQGR